ncbi:MAG: hypothetical protein U0353_00180 [Sandaracinus sp.]
MSRLALVLAVVVLALAPTSAGAQAPRSLSLFPHQASITEPPNTYGLVRLPLGPDVLSAARPNLGDVRVHDAYGEEVPYAIDRGDTPYPTSSRSESHVVVPFDAGEHTQTDHGVVTSTETYRLRPPSSPSYGGTWELLVQPEGGELVRQVVVRAEPPFGEPREVTRTSIFRFARYGNERLAIPLPSVNDEPLVVEFSGQGAPIHPRFELREIDRSIVRPPTATVPLTIRESHRDGTRTIVVLERPAGFRTVSLTFETTTPSFVRNVEVRSSASPSGVDRVLLGTGGLVRVAGVEIPELLVVSIGDGGGDLLEVAIEDGDSPSLEGLAVTAQIRVPALLFDSGRAQTLRWGGLRARAPHYDLMTTDVASLVRDRPLYEAHLGPVGDNPEYDDTPALSFAMRAGQPVELARETHRASLAVRASHDGLSTFAVPPALWAQAREDLGDLRVVDAEARQWPYVFVPNASPDELEVTVAAGVPDADDPHHSLHELALPVSAMSPTVVRVELPPQLVARTVTARGRDLRGEEVELGVSNFLSNEDAPARLELSLFGERVTALWLDVDNGDEAPLPITTATVVQPAHVGQLVAPEGSYWLVVGDVDATAPVYDLEQAAALLLVLEAEAATVGPVEANPAFHEPTFFERSGWETIVLSVVLGLVVLVLFGLTLRIARSESGPAPTPADAKPAEGTAKPSDGAAKPSDEPARPSDDAAKPSDDAAKPSDEPAKPSDGAAKPSDEPAKPSDEPAKPSDEA